MHSPEPRDEAQPSLLDCLIEDTASHVVFLRLKDSESPVRPEIVTDAFIVAGIAPESIETMAGGAAPVWRVQAQILEETLGYIKDAHVDVPGQGRVALSERLLVDIRPVRNRALRSAEAGGAASGLRRCVLRDVAALLNTENLASAQDLADYPRVAASVVNFGLPSLTGRRPSRETAAAAAEGMRKALQRFEPRLSGVRVRYELNLDDVGEDVLTFIIDADLWGEPGPERITLRSRADANTGSFYLLPNSN